jgi:hypothetical protein
MFVIKKIFNSATNAPDPVRIAVNSTEEYKIGTLLTLKSGKLSNTVFGEVPTHIACQSLKVGEHGSILCYEITPDMLFLAPIEGTPLGLKTGEKLALGFDGVFADKVIDDIEDGVFTIYDIRGAKRDGDMVYLTLK